VNWKITIIAGLILISGDLYAKKVDGKTVPFHTEISGYLIDFNEDANAIAARCTTAPEGKVAWAIASFDGWGDVTHLGWTYFYADHCSYRPEFGSPDGTYSEGEFYMTAANGDRLTGTYYDGISFPGDPPMVYFIDYFMFDDRGDGRFNFASGEGVDAGSIDFGDFSFTIQMTGVIAYSKR
jgi:hypothetical protein